MPVAALRLFSFTTCRRVKLSTWRTSSLWVYTSVSLSSRFC